MELIQLARVIDQYRLLQNTVGSSKASVFFNGRGFLDRFIDYNFSKRNLLLGDN